MRSTFWSLGVVSLAGLCPAQGPVVPSSFSAAEGGGGTSIPFGLDRPVRMQGIYDADELPFSGPRLIQGLAMRADFSADAGRDQYPQKQFLILHLSLSTTHARAWEASPTFGDNHGTDLTQVTMDARISLPAQPPTGAGPRAFNIDIPFDRPWFYGLTPIRGPGPPPTGLLFDMQIVAQPAGAYRIDVPGNCSSDPTWFGQIGPGCVTSAAGLPLSIEATSSVVAGGNITYTIGQMPPDAFFAVAMATSDQGDWLGNQLPFDLTGYLQGAPGCWINVPWQAVIVGQADPMGVGRTTIPIPLNRNVVGSFFYAQAICRDLAANPLLHVTSEGLRSTVCGPLGVARIYNVGDAWALSGQRSIGVAPIIELR